MADPIGNAEPDSTEYRPIVPRRNQIAGREPEGDHPPIRRAIKNAISSACE
jgi:hypothetical protein